MKAPIVINGGLEQTTYTCLGVIGADPLFFVNPMDFYFDFYFQRTSMRKKSAVSAL